MLEKKFDKVKYNNKFNSEKYDRLGIMLPKGKKEIIKNFAGKQGKSLNGFVNEAIDEKIERDNK